MSLVKTVSLLIPSTVCKPGPSIGQSLGPLGVSMADFVKQFNERTSGWVPGTPTPVKLSAFSDRTFEFRVSSPPASYLLGRAAGVEKGAERPGGRPVGTVTRRACYEIALIKGKDQGRDHLPIEGVFKSVLGTAGR